MQRGFNPSFNQDFVITRALCVQFPETESMYAVNLLSIYIDKLKVNWISVCSLMQWRCWNHLWQIEEKLFRFANDWSCAANLTPWPDQFNGVDQFRATIALISTCVFITTARMRASTFNKPISQVTITFLTKQLIDGFYFQIAVAIQFFEVLLNHPIECKHVNERRKKHIMKITGVNEIR